MMEEAYAQLYQQFVCLRSLCLRQASMLQKLTAALKQQQGGSNGDLGDITSVTQLDSEYPEYLNTTPHPPPPLIPPTAPCGIQEPSKNFSDLLTQDMSKLSVDTSVQKKNPKHDLSIPQPLSSVPGLMNGASFNKCLHLNGEEARKNIPVPGALTPSSGTPYTYALTPSTGLMLSDVALQSHMCEICQAVFPANTTTRGQYLQHLYTHIT